MSRYEGPVVTGGPSNYDPDLYNKKREELLKILPTDQAQLPPRRMLDSFDSAIIPIASDLSLRVIKYIFGYFVFFNLLPPRIVTSWQMEE